jgi:hypothetical protein
MPPKPHLHQHLPGPELAGVLLDDGELVGRIDHQAQAAQAQRSSFIHVLFLVIVLSEPCGVPSWLQHDAATTLP